MFHITAPLKSVSVEYRGTNNFTIATLRVNMSIPGSRAPADKFLDLQATGAEGDRVAATLQDAPEGAFVRLICRPTFREYNGSTFMNLEIVDSTLQGGFGSVDGGFSAQGFVLDLEERAGSREPFFIGEIGMIAYGREGLVPNAKIDMIVPTELVPAWRAAQGKYAIVSGTVSGYLSPKNDKAYPRFVASGITGAMDTPSWLSEHAPGAVTVTEVVLDSAPVPF